MDVLDTVLALECAWEISVLLIMRSIGVCRITRLTMPVLKLPSCIPDLPVLKLPSCRPDLQIFLKELKGVSLRGAELGPLV